MSFRDDAHARRYELDVEGAVAFATYREEVDGRRALLHFETPAALRRQGVAGRLMAQILNEARASGLHLRARCSYAVDYLARHPEAGDALSL